MDSEHLKHTDADGWFLAANEATRVSDAQAVAINLVSDIESIGASDVRFDDSYGDLIIFQTDDRVTHVTADGVISASPSSGPVDYGEVLRTYGYSDEQITEMAEENTRKLRAIGAMNRVGRERGTVDHEADRYNYLRALRSRPAGRPED